VFLVKDPGICLASTLGFCPSCHHKTAYGQDDDIEGPCKKCSDILKAEDVDKAINHFIQKHGFHWVSFKAALMLGLSLSPIKKPPRKE